MSSLHSGPMSVFIAQCPSGYPICNMPLLMCHSPSSCATPFFMCHSPSSSCATPPLPHVPLSSSCATPPPHVPLPSSCATPPPHVPLPLLLMCHSPPHVPFPSSSCATPPPHVPLPSSCATPPPPHVHLPFLTFNTVPSPSPLPHPLCPSHAGSVAPPFQAMSTRGPSAQQLKNTLQLEVDENTPQNYSRLVCSNGNEVGAATGFPIRVSTLFTPVLL